MWPSPLLGDPIRARRVTNLYSPAGSQSPHRKESGMRRITAVVYGVGAMNSIATRLMLEKGVDIVGAIARSSEKVGRDLGEVAGLGYETGVIVEDDPERVLSTRTADIAVIAIA